MTQEQRIVFILINYLALEGAQNHFTATLPPDELFESLKQEMQIQSPPQFWRNHYVDNREIKDELPAFEYAWKCLKGIRNNLFHANKAMQPDTPERLDFLLRWSVDFINAIYDADGDLARKAQKIKEVLQIRL